MFGSSSRNSDGSFMADQQDCQRELIQNNISVQSDKSNRVKCATLIKAIIFF